MGALLLGAACASPIGRPVQPPSSHTVQQELGQRDVLLAGAEFARQRGYAVAEGEAVEVRPNYWRVRFALAPRGSGRLLQLEFDEASGSVLRAQEVELPLEFQADERP